MTTEIENTVFTYECEMLKLKSTTPIPCGTYSICARSNCPHLPKKLPDMPKHRYVKASDFKEPVKFNYYKQYTSSIYDS